MIREYRWVSISLLFFAIIFMFGGCEVKNPTDGVKVILDVPFKKEISNEPAVTVDAESTEIAKDYQFSNGLAKGIGKNKDGIMELKDTEMVRFPMGLTNQEFLTNYMTNPNPNAVLFGGKLTNHGAYPIQAQFYLATSHDSILIKQTGFISSNYQYAIQIRLSELESLVTWMEARASQGLYVGIKLIGTPPHNAVLEILNMYTPPFFYLSRIVQADDLEDYDLEEIKSVEITGTVTNKGVSPVIFSLFMTSLKNTIYTKQLIGTTTFAPGVPIIVEDMNPPFITDQDLDDIEAAVETLFHGAHIEFEIYCYSLDGVSGINMSIEDLAVNTQSIVSQTQ